MLTNFTECHPHWTCPCSTLALERVKSRAKPSIKFISHSWQSCRQRTRQYNTHTAHTAHTKHMPRPQDFDFDLEFVNMVTYVIIANSISHGWPCLCVASSLSSSQLSSAQLCSRDITVNILLCSAHAQFTHTSINECVRACISIGKFEFISNFCDLIKSVYGNCSGRTERARERETAYLHYSLWVGRNYAYGYLNLA